MKDLANFDFDKIRKNVSNLDKKAQRDFARIMDNIREFDMDNILMLLLLLNGDHLDNSTMEEQISKTLEVWEVGTRNYIPIGEFGYDITNPIMARGIGHGYKYLDSIECSNGDPIRYERVGSFNANAIPITEKKGDITFFVNSSSLEDLSTEQLSKPIDGYHIYNSRTDEEIAFLYIYPYSHETSKTIPSGFRFNDEYMKTPPAFRFNRTAEDLPPKLRPSSSTSNNYIWWIGIAILLAVIIILFATCS